MLADQLRRVQVTRYVAPLREGGSLPAIVEADDGFLYVLKFRGAGQGTKALIADLLGGELARAVGLRTPELVFCDLDEAFGRLEPDQEIQDLLRASEGLNLGSHFLSGAITFDPAVSPIDALLASKIVWLDAFLSNVDRTIKNTNLLYWHKELWIIDHGASLYFHHNWQAWEEAAAKPFKLVKDHALLRQASRLAEADAEAKSKLNDKVIRRIVNLIPDEWISDPYDFPPELPVKDVYFNYLKTRLLYTPVLIKETEDARKTLV